MEPETIYEHLDGPCERRKELLQALGDALGTDQVPAAFWACLHVCSLKRLEWIVENARVAPFFVSAFADQCLFSLALPWAQKPRDQTGSASESQSDSSQGPPSKRQRRERGPKALAEERDKEACALTGTVPYQVAHIYPNSLISTQSSLRIPVFWKLLSAFWPEETIRSWRTQIFRGQDLSKPSDAPFNMICMKSTSHQQWGSGYFAFRPLEYNDDRSKLEVEIHWLPSYDHTSTDSVSLSKPTQSTGDRENSTNRKGQPTEKLVIDGKNMKSGDTIWFTTSDPQRLPVPSKELLHMQWLLTRVMSMSAAAEYQEDFDDQKPDYDPTSAMYADQFSVDKWLSSVNPQNDETPSNLPAPSAPASSPSDMDSGSESMEQSLTTASADPSPVKARVEPSQQLTSIEEGPYFSTAGDS